MQRRSGSPPGELVENTRADEPRELSPLGRAAAWVSPHLVFSRVRAAAVAAAAAALTAACLVRFGATGRGAVASFFAVVLVTLSAIDLERRLLPNRIVIPAALIVLAAHTILFPDRALEWLVAAVGAALFLLVPLLVYPAGMGMGDVKLALLLGAGLGRDVVLALVVALVASLVVSIGILLRKGLAGRKTAVPFGPFLAFGALVALFAGSA